MHLTTSIHTYLLSSTIILIHFISLSQFNIFNVELNSKVISKWTFTWKMHTFLNSTVFYWEFLYTFFYELKYCDLIVINSVHLR